MAGRLVVRAADVERQAMIEDDPVAELRFQRFVGLAIDRPQIAPGARTGP